MTDTFSVAVEKKNGTAQPFRLAFQKKDEVGQDLGQRRIGSNHLQHATLSRAKKFFLFHLGDVPANNDAA